MKKQILIYSAFIFIIFTLFYLAINYPKGTFKIEDENIKILISITDNLLVARDPECTKKVTIFDGNKKYKISYWSEVYEVKIFKRKNEKESFWIIDDYYRGVSRTVNGEFPDFTCEEPECWTENSIEGENVLGFEFKNGKWRKIKL